MYWCVCSSLPAPEHHHHPDQEQQHHPALDPGLPRLYRLPALYRLLQPASPNGLISGYRLYYMTSEVTDVVTVKDSSQEIVFQLKNLSEYKAMRTGEMI